MKTMIFLFMASILSFSSCSDKSAKSKAITIKEVWMYEHFVLRGYSVGGAYRQFEELEKENTPKFKLDTQNVDYLNNIVSSSEMKNNFIGKLGQYMLFTSVVTNDDKVLKIAVLQNMIIDYTNQKTGYRFYFIKKKEHQEWLSNFVKDRIKE